MSDLVGPLLGLAVVGVVGGLATLVRGLGGYRRLLRLEGFGSSLPRSVAVGEARLAGTVQAAEVTLVSPLQSRPCVYYRASVDAGDGRSRQRVFSEERGVGFRLESETGSIRVFPSGAQWDVPDSWSGNDLLGDPPGLELRTGPATTMAAGLETREQAVADLLTVHRPEDGGGVGTSMAAAGGRRSYREARLSVGDAVTVIGMVLPFDQLPDPSAANEESGAAASDETADPVVAADLAAARAAGGLADSTSDAWGNAAIEGFGIDRPVREPVLDPGARRPQLATADEGRRADVAFDIAPETLVVAAAPGVPLMIASGAPSGAESRNEWRFVTGLAGAVLAIVSAVAVIVLLSGTWP